MRTEPCSHQVVCRRCFIATIQAAVTQRSLPLRCVLCRTPILKLGTSDRSPHPFVSTSSSSSSSSHKTAMMEYRCSRRKAAVHARSDVDGSEARRRCKWMAEDSGDALLVPYLAISSSNKSSHYQHDLQ